MTMPRTYILVLLAVAAGHCPAAEQMPAKIPDALGPTASPQANKAPEDSLTALSEKAQGAVRDPASPIQTTAETGLPPPPPVGEGGANASVPPKEFLAVGAALLPSRPEAEAIHFENVKASEVVLRFSKEYRVSIVLFGDGSQPISGAAKKDVPVDAMLREIFPEPGWQVIAKPTSILVSQKPPISFRKISMTEINPAAVTPPSSQDAKK